MRDTYCESGTAAALLEKYQLDGAGVYAQISAFLK
jgi:transketolase C-terminal domain/subunit